MASRRRSATLAAFSDGLLHHANAVPLPSDRTPGRCLVDLSLCHCCMLAMRQGNPQESIGTATKVDLRLGTPRVFLKLAKFAFKITNKKDNNDRKNEETEQLTNARPWKNDSGHTGMCCFYETGQVSSSFCPLCLISTQGIASVDEGIIGTQ